MKKYRIDAGRHDLSARIDEIEVDRETDSSIWVNGRRLAKFTEWHNHYDTWDKAHTALMERQQSRCESLRRNLGYSEMRLDSIKMMRQEE